MCQAQSPSKTRGVENDVVKHGVGHGNGPKCLVLLRAWTDRNDVDVIHHSDRNGENFDVFSMKQWLSCHTFFTAVLVTFECSDPWIFSPLL